MCKINVKVAWMKNQFVGTTTNIPGIVTSVAPSFEELKATTAENIKAHVRELGGDGKELPSWLAEGKYEISFFMNPEELESSPELYNDSYTERT